MAVRARRRMFVLIGMVLASAGLSGTGPLQRAGGAGANPVTLGSGNAPCGGQEAMVSPTGHVACTHGSDPPGGQPPIPARLALATDLKWPVGNVLPEPTAEDPPGPAPAAQGIRCYGDGLSGNRVEVMYARPSDRPDRFAQVLPSIRRWAAEVDAVFSSSAARFGAVRHVRYVTGEVCDLVVANIVLSPTSDDTFQNTISELSARGFNKQNRKYLVWLDAEVLCGIAQSYPDDEAGPGNPNNGHVPGQVARTDASCWGRGASGHSTEAHELLHTLGGVMPTAPNASANGHCTDESDLMCYSDADIIKMKDVCGQAQEALLDCGDDDYFNPSPAPGSYLATHWNTAHSSFLAHDEGIPAIDTVGTAVVEGDDGTTAAGVVVSLSAPAPEGVSVRYTTVGDSAAEGVDFVASEGIVSFPPGQTTAMVDVPVTGDFDDESEESLVLRLFNPTRGVLRTTEARVAILDDEPKRQGYWLYGADGGVFAFGDAPFRGSLADTPLDQRIVGMAPAGPSGYWLAGNKGKIFPVEARNLGSVSQPDIEVTAMAGTPTGAGYAVLDFNGRVFPFGDAADLGLTSGPRVANAGVIGMAWTPSGGGYWLAGQDGRMYPFGDAPDLGSLANPPPQPIFGMAATPTGRGYWLVDADGNVSAFGDAPALGSPLSRGATFTGIASTPTGRGYWVTDAGGAVFPFGDAPDLGSVVGQQLRGPILGIVSLR